MVCLFGMMIFVFDCLLIMILSDFFGLVMIFVNLIEFGSEVGLVMIDLMIKCGVVGLFEIVVECLRMVLVKVCVLIGIEV